MKKLYTYITIFTISILIFTSCTEPYEPKTGTFEEALVIESTITNKLKKQTVKLSRVKKLESDFYNTEKNAHVWIKANNETYTFTEIEAGTYQSNIAFKAVPDVEYTLFITTENGKKYKSTPSFLTPEAPISNVYAQKETVNNQLGVQVFLDNNNTGNAKYFRYEFEETYKIVTPYIIYDDIHIGEAYYTVIGPLYVINFPYYLTPVTEEKHICYASNTQEEILQSTITNSSNTNIIKFPVQFINHDSPMMRNRYSILVKQYSQSFDAYNFYNILKKLGGIGSLLSQNQTGMVRGNVTAVDGTKETVIGFFDVSSVSEKRIYFNYEDFGFDKAEYPYECYTYLLDYADFAPEPFDQDINEREFLYQYLVSEKPPYEILNATSFNGTPRIFEVVNPECSNCNTFASNIRPDFWVD